MFAVIHGELRSGNVTDALRAHRDVVEGPSAKGSSNTMSHLGAILRRTTAAAAVACGLIVGIPSTPALAINEVDCAGRDDFARLTVLDHRSNGDISRHYVCFANADAKSINIYGVTEAWSGDNKVTVNYESGGHYYTKTIGYWESAHLDNVRVYEIRIW